MSNQKKRGRKPESLSNVRVRSAMLTRSLTPAHVQSAFLLSTGSAFEDIKGTRFAARLVVDVLMTCDEISVKSLREALKVKACDRYYRELAALCRDVSTKLRETLEVSY